MSDALIQSASCRMVFSCSTVFVQGSRRIVEKGEFLPGRQGLGKRPAPDAHHLLNGAPASFNPQPEVSSKNCGHEAKVSIGAQITVGILKAVRR